MDVDALGGPEREPGRHTAPEGREGPRTVAVLAVAALLGLLAVGGVFWLVTSGLGGSTTGGGAAAAAPAVSTSGSSTTTTPDEGPTTITSTLTSTSRTTTPSPTLDLPPPELPTYTLAPTATVPAGTTAPAPNRSTPAPKPPPTTAPAQPRVTNAQLSCKRTRNAVKGTLSFTTTAPVQAYLVGGGKVASGVRGPGSVTMTVNGGDGAGYCLATVGGQTLGPVPAR
ncbi:hypothetical protein [Lapillicoccus jejuensis]|uniref:Uncharacterized protein n=1 Tax=Lapillicoccus jejuensis TaxID=402171 RepID=A0A542E0C5_9MICO|nr:hypothetical protein [Lapillicoccus jejuensis]TQJ08801.1 hypothetical protein FB458_1896 [Lapillicoccus jejuensis]